MLRRNRTQTRMRASAQCVNPLESMRAVRCSSTPPAQTVEQSFKSRFRSPEAASRSRSEGVSARVFRSEDLKKFFFLP